MNPLEVMAREGEGKRHQKKAEEELNDLLVYPCTAPTSANKKDTEKKVFPFAC